MDDRADRHRLRRLSEQLDTVMESLEQIGQFVQAIQTGLGKHRQTLREVRDEMEAWSGLPTRHRERDLEASIQDYPEVKLDAPVPSPEAKD